MASIIKNQILKHLSKFTKNLSTDNFNFSTFKGEGELTDLLLDETVLTDLLELPSWLRLTSARVNRVSFRIPWAKLKSHPIHLSLDEVLVEVETCEELRTSSCTQGLSSYAGAAKYSFIHKVIDGMTVTVNTVLVTFRSPAFSSTVELSRVVVESRSPEWRRTELSGTRKKDEAKLHVLLFKELEWQNVRIEARSTLDPSLTPLRLITNRASCRIILKKRIKDSCIMGCRLVVTLDDLLWVLTDLQLKAALHFLDSLAGLIQKATELTRKKKAARKLEEVPEYRAQQAQLLHQAKSQMDSGQNHAPRLNKIDVVETSYHFIAHKIDLHIVDDNSDTRSGHPSLQKGASLQVSLRCLQADLYPYHLAAGDRSHWPMYREADSFHSQWIRGAYNDFSEKLIEQAKLRAQMVDEEMTPSKVKAYVTKELATLMSSCVVLRLADVIVYHVAPSSTKNFVPKELISGDKERYHLPPNSPILHAEFTYYFYPTDDPFPLPSPSLCIHVDPVQAVFDEVSLLWLHAFAVSLELSLAHTKGASNDLASSLASFEVHAVAINPRLIIEATDNGVGRDRVRALHATVARACVTNVRHASGGLLPELRQAVTAFRLSTLFYQSDFPCDATDLRLRVDAFEQMCSSLDEDIANRNHSQAVATTLEELRRVLYETVSPTAKELWCVTLDPVNCVTLGRGAVTVPVCDRVPVTLWVRPQLLPALRVQALAHVPNLLSAQVNHYQLVFLLRLSERLESFTTQLSEDAARLMGGPSDIQVVLGAMVPQVDITLLMPTLTPGKGSSAGDGESLVPDSSSLQDDNWQSSGSVFNDISQLTKHKASQEHIRFSSTTPNEGAKTPSDSARNHASEVKSDVARGPPFELPKYISIETVSNGGVKPIERRLSIGRMSFTEEGVSFGDFRRAFKKGLGTIAASLDMDRSSNVIADDASSTISIHSESSDGLPGVDPLYCSIGVVEEAAEVMEEPDQLTLTSPTSPSDRDSASASIKRHDWVSLCTVKLRPVELVFQLDGPASVVKVQIGSVGLAECPSIPWEEFQSKFRGRHRGGVDFESVGATGRQVRARLSRSGAAVAQLHAQVRDVRLTITASCVSRLVEMLEDDIRPPPLPAHVVLQDIELKILDDRPGLCSEGEELASQDVLVRRLVVLRHASGLVELPSQVATPTQCDDHEEEMRRLRAENEQLRRRLAQLDRLTDENLRLRDYHSQSEKLRGCLTEAQDRVASLLEDKRALLDRVGSLQLDLNNCNSKR